MYIDIEEACNILVDEAHSYGYMHPIEQVFIHNKKEDINAICFSRSQYSIIFKFYNSDSYVSYMSLWEIHKPSVIDPKIKTSIRFKQSNNFLFLTDNSLLFKFVNHQFKRGLKNTKLEYDDFVSNLEG